MQAHARAGVMALMALAPSLFIEIQTQRTNGTKRKAEKHKANGVHSFKKRGIARDNGKNCSESPPAALVALIFCSRSENVSEAAREMRMQSAGIGMQRARWSSGAAL